MSFKLNRIDNFSRNPVLLVIMDGIGVGLTNHPYPDGDCVKNADTPNLDLLKKWAEEKNLYTELKAHGIAAGLPSDKDMGNSEVGHNALGAGRVFNQGAKIVNQGITDRTIFETDTWKSLIDIKEDNTIHLIGLVSDGNVHSHIDQLFALLDELAQKNIKKVRVHSLLDGRDVPERSALNYIRPLEKKFSQLNKNNNFDYKIASGGGRMHVTMDRYNSDWNVVIRGWHAHVLGIPEIYDGYSGYFSSAEEAIDTARKLDVKLTDQYLPSFVIVDKEKNPVGKINDGDSVIFFNYRGDRAIQISRAFEEDNFIDFDRVLFPKVKYAGMLEYDGDLKIPKNYLVPPPEISSTISQYLCAEDITQFVCAETHKYGHVTYFWNGNNSGYINENLEKYIEIPSDPSERVYDKPEMKTGEVCDEVEKALKSGKYNFIRVNFANGDMCGHTGFKETATIGVETTDNVVGRLKDIITELNGVMLVTADHGNSEEMVDKKGNTKTSHTTNPVPFYIWDPQFNNEYELNTLDEPQLANVAATVLNFLGFSKPDEYYPSLIKI
jgi:2,3-bisphosphoglycerate-independent phosphoglycerate mutase